MTGMSISSSEVHVLPLVQRYLKQQAFLYGDELILTERRFSGKPCFSTLSDLKQRIAECQECGLGRLRKHLVIGAGNENATLMLIGEAPGEEEDRQGVPFVGEAGKLLDKVLEAIGFQREEVYIANILKCRPPGNRDPQPDEVQHCMPYLTIQIALIRPRMLLILGRVAAQSLLATSLPLNRLRRQWHTWSGIPALVTYHPAALLRTAAFKRDTWEDVQLLRHEYDRIVGDKPVWRPKKA